uniref:Uncharacterized protein n=1 Tax=viral metagenome TaxID=1070528 RepID=A0A6C0C9X7_9ZZZZ
MPCLLCDKHLTYGTCFIFSAEKTKSASFWIPLQLFGIILDYFIYRMVDDKYRR